MLKKIFFTAFITVAITASAQLSQEFDTLSQSYYQNGLFEGTVLIADSTGIVYISHSVTPIIIFKFRTTLQQFFALVLWKNNLLQCWCSN